MIAMDGGNANFAGAKIGRVNYLILKFTANYIFMNFGKLKTSSLENFPLKWRWTDANYNVLPKDDLSFILPLNNDAAKIVDDVSNSCYSSENNNFTPCNEKFEDIESIGCNNNESINDWLSNRMFGDNIVISWSPTMAVITLPKVFIKYWDDFCYPSSDDVSIWPESEEWVLHYTHSNLFWFGRAKE